MRPLLDVRGLTLCTEATARKLAGTNSLGTNAVGTNSPGTPSHDTNPPPREQADRQLVKPKGVKPEEVNTERVKPEQASHTQSKMEQTPRPQPLVDGLSFCLEAGKTLGIIGESGSGKSLACMAIAGLLPAGVEQTSGTITITLPDEKNDQQTGAPSEGRAHTSHARAVATQARAVETQAKAPLPRHTGQAAALIMQNPASCFDPLYTIRQTFYETFTDNGLFRGKDYGQSALALLLEAGFATPEPILDKYPFQLSGGMLHRVMLALALALQRPLLLADEPVSGMDTPGQAATLRLLQTLQHERGFALIYIDHNISMAERIADNLLVMKSGRAVEYGPTAEIMGNPQQEYTKLLLAAHAAFALPVYQCLDSLHWQGISPRRQHAADFQTRHEWHLSNQPNELGQPNQQHLTGQRNQTGQQNQTGQPQHMQQEQHIQHMQQGQPVRQRQQSQQVQPNQPSQQERATAQPTGSVGIPLLECRDLGKAYGSRFFSRNKTEVLHGVSLSVHEGESHGLVGLNGSGKSTLVRLLLGLERPDSGAVYVQGVPLTTLCRKRLFSGEDNRWRKNIQPVFQDSRSSVNPRFSVRDILEEPLTAYGLDKKQRRQRCGEVLELVGLPTDCIHRLPHTLSGGQLQRVCIARALSLNPALLLLDEALTDLDALIQEQLLTLLENLRGELGMAYLFVSHDLRAVFRLCSRVTLLHNGEVAETVQTAEGCEAPQHPVFRELFEACLPQAEQQKGPLPH